MWVFKVINIRVCLTSIHSPYYNNLIYDSLIREKLYLVC